MVAKSVAIAAWKPFEILAGPLPASEKLSTIPPVKTEPGPLSETLKLFD